MVIPKGKEPSALSLPLADEPKSNLDTYLKILSGVQEQIRFADSKAAFIAALNALLFGFVTNHLDKLRSANGAVRILAGFYALAALGALIFVIIAVVSRFGELAPQCKVFFGHIAKHYGKDYEKYWRETKDLDDSDWAKEIASQIVEVCHIATKKHKLVRCGAVCTLIALGLWFLTLVLAAILPISH